MKLKILLLVLFIGILTSCDDPVSDTENEGNNNDIFHFLNSSSSYDGYLYSFEQVSISQTQNNYSQNFYTYLYDSTGNYIEPDESKINSQTLAIHYDNQASVNFDGISYHEWEITGNIYFPSFTDSILSMKSFEITNYSMLDTVSKSNGFIINHSSITQSDSLYIIVKVNQILSNKFIDEDIETNGNERYYRMQAVNGTVQLSSPDLNDIPKDRIIKVQLVAGTFKDKELVDRTVRIGSIVESYIYLYLEN